MWGKTKNSSNMSEKEMNSEKEILNEKEELAQNQETENQEQILEEDEITLLKNQYNELNDKYLRLHAEFDNYRKRTSKERIDLIKTAGEEIIISMLPVLDDLDRALISFEKATEIDAVKQGVLLIHNKIISILNQKGLKNMDCLKQTFDPELQEAITEIPVDSKELYGKIVDVIEQGYCLGDKVIRHAKVVVGKKN